MKRKLFLREWFSRYFLDSIPYPSEQVAYLKKLHEEGTVVYVHRFKSVFLHWAIKRAILNHQLPSKQTGALEFFLRIPRTLVNSKKKSSLDYLEKLIEQQKKQDKPFFLVPHWLVLGARPSKLQLSATDMIFGSRHEPGFLRMLIRILMSHRWARWEAAEAIDLKELLAQDPSRTTEAVARQVQWRLFKRFNYLQRAFHGPLLKSYNRLRMDTLRDKDLQAYMAKIEAETGIPPRRLEKKADSFYSEIAARFDVDVVRIFEKVLGWVWNRIYDGLIWNASDLERLKKASKRAPLVIVPSHKSHVDYLVISQILYWEGLMLPHIAAGTNLSFFPLGSIFRRGGAYFIRRTFKGDPLYPQVVRAYVKRLFKEGFTQEFFIEGGRSRSGKVLTPKLGFLSIMVDCLTKGKITDAMFVPACISYEKLVEADEYRRELVGGEKTAESTAGLLKSAEVLKKKYGQVYVTFDEPISFADFVSERLGALESIDESQRKELTKSLAHRIMFGMNRCSVITASSLISTVLLTSRKRTLPRSVLFRNIKKIIRYIQHNGAEYRLSDDLIKGVRAPVQKALDLFVLDQLLLTDKAGDTTYYRSNEKFLLSLDFYKNNILHHFVSDAIIATAFIALCGSNRHKWVKLSYLKNHTQLLSQVFKYEFIYPVGEPFSNLFQKRLESAVQSKILILEKDMVCLSPTKEAQWQLTFATRLIANFVDAYWICAQKLESAVSKSANKKALSLNLLDYLKEAHLNGLSDYPEIVSRTIVENAILLFTDYEILIFENQKPQIGTGPQMEEMKRVVQLLQACHYSHVV